MPVKTLLFGAGQGAANFMFACREERTYVGLLDNDVNKHGTAVHGLPVYSPDSIADITFDEIVVTTQWALEVYEQLTKKIGLPESKVIMPEKSKLKKLNQEPFSHPPTLQLGRDIVKQISALALVQNVPLVVDFGTLLGLVRDGDIIPWDDDIDFAAPQESANKVKVLLQQFILQNASEVDWFIQELVDNQGQVSGYLLNFTDNKQQRVPFTTSFSLRNIKDGQAKHMPSLGMWYAPAAHFEKSAEYLWQDCLIPVPNEYEAYLTFQYGDWQTPKQNMQLSDYAHINSVDFDDVQSAGLTARKVES